MLTDQEIFDTVAKHLLEQGKQSTESHRRATRCAYRGDDNRMCAVGCLIPDSMYDPHIEGVGLWSLEHTHDAQWDEGTMLLDSILTQSGIGIDSYAMLADLQAIHDDGDLWSDIDFPSELLKQLAIVALKLSERTRW